MPVLRRNFANLGALSGVLTGNGIRERVSDEMRYPDTGYTTFDDDTPGSDFEIGSAEEEERP